MEELQLGIFPQNSEVAQYYTESILRSNEDSGIDLYFPETVTFKVGQTKIVDLQIKCVLKENGVRTAFQLYPRSSISKTPLRLANSVGVIDKGYNGNLKVALTYVPTQEDLNLLHFDPYTILPNDCTEAECLRLLLREIKERHDRFDGKVFTVEQGTRLAQLCSPDLKPITNVEIISKLEETQRGEGGFGSTGTH